MPAKKVIVKPLPPEPPRAAPGQPASARRNDLRGPPPLDVRPPGEEHRQFPRARMAVPFQCWIGEGEDRRFSATLMSSNLSVSGAFLSSTFFLPIGTEMRVSFVLEEDSNPVQARGQIVREERPASNDEDWRSGFGIRFVEFFGQTEVTLAKLFLGDKLRDFAGEYLQSKRAKSLNNELDRVVDALAAWELLKVTTPGDPWRPQ